MPGLFDTAGFVPRAHCGTGWTPDKIWWDNFANLLVFSAYLVIPVILLVMMVWLWRHIPKPEKGGHGTDEWDRLCAAHPLVGFPVWVVGAFALFIFSCGVGHLWDVVVFRWPAYNLFIAWNLLTGVASWVAIGGAVQVAVWLSRRFLVLWRTLEQSIDRTEASLERERTAHAEKAKLVETLATKNAQMELILQTAQADLDEIQRERAEKERNNQSDLWLRAKHAALDSLLSRMTEIAANDTGGRDP